MKPILQAVRRAPSLEGASLLAFFFVVLNLEIFVFANFALQDPLWMLPAGYALHVVLLAVFGGALFVWMGLFLTGRVSAATGAAFRIACLGLVATLLSGVHSVAFMFESSGRSVYDAFPAVGGLLWVGRNVGLAAYAFGLVFVALSCWGERRLRRTAPAWTLPLP